MVSGAPPVVGVDWPWAFRIIRSRFPTIDLFEDIADPADWGAIASAEAKTNPRVAESVGNLDLVPPVRRVGGECASWVMAPLTHVSPDRKSRFSDGSYGVYFCGDGFEVALFETIHHHAAFMAATAETAGWTSEFRELVGTLDARLHDLGEGFDACLDPNDYAEGQRLGARLRAEGSDGVVYPSVRYPGGLCAAAFWPDVVGVPRQGRHLAYHWDGGRVDLVKDLYGGTVFEVVAASGGP